MQNQLQAFLAALSEDVSLQVSLRAAADLDAVVAIARDAGFVITVEQITQLQSDLSDSELSAITGGISTIDHLRNFGTAIFC